MGQYYKFIILGDDKKNGKEVILLVIHPRCYNEGSKIMEHSYLNTNLMNTVEYLISHEGPFYNSRILWAGDYAQEEDDTGNLYRIADDYSSFEGQYCNPKLRYIANHTKKVYVDKLRNKNDDDNNNDLIHPLPLLISEGNGSGGGDYRGNNIELCGTWARDVISMLEEIPDNYDEVVCDFEEY